MHSDWSKDDDDDLRSGDVSSTWLLSVRDCRYGLFAGKTVLPYLSALENAIVFKGALQMSRFTLLFG